MVTWEKMVDIGPERDGDSIPRGGKISVTRHVLRGKRRTRKVAGVGEK